MPSENERKAAVRALKEGDVIAGSPTRDQLLNIVDHVLHAAEEQRVADAPNPFQTFMHLMQTNKADIDVILAKVGGISGALSLMPAILHIMKTATEHPDHEATLKSMAQGARGGAA